MKTVEAPTQDAALRRLTEELGIQQSELKYVSSKNRSHTFEVLSCPASIDVEIAKDGMKATIRRIRLPIGGQHPSLNVQLILDELKKKGVVAGIKREIISAEVFKILKNPNYDDTAPLSVVVAEGVLPQNGVVSKPKYTFDIKIFEKSDAHFVKKGDIVAVAPEAATAKDGQKVTGEVISATIEEQGKLPVSQGIKSQRVGADVKYIVENTGRLYFDQGIRLRVDPALLTLNEGMVVAAFVQNKNIFNSPFTGADISEWAIAQGVKFGLLPNNEIDLQLKNQKKWPAQITIARGKQPVDGKAGAIRYNYKEPKSTQAIDQARVKAAIVFPGEIILTIAPPSQPESGQTPFGEVLRARPYSDMPIYPGKGIVKEKLGEDIVFKATAYGKVTTDTDRIHVVNILKVSADKMKVTIDLFPQIKMTLSEFAPLLREADILMSPVKEEFDARLDKIFQNAKRVEDFVIVEGLPPQAGKDASLVYRFDPAPFKDKGLFQKKSDPLLVAAPGDLLLTKMEPLEATGGMNVYREKIPVPQSKTPKDIQIQAGKGIEVKKLGKEGVATDPFRIEYRAARFGTLVWKDFFIDINSTVEVDKEEKVVLIALAPVTDFGTKLTMEVFAKIGEAEAIRVDLAQKILEEAIRHPRAPDRSLRRTVLAEAIPLEHGKNAQIQYLVEINDEPIDKYLSGSASTVPEIISADCVRPGDVLAIKTPATLGQDGKTVFGKRLPADRGKDEPWFIGEGVAKSGDGLQITCQTKAPGFVFIDLGKIIVKTPVKVAQDKMSATISLYPSKNPRFQLREDKVLGMLEQSGIKYGIKREAIRALIQEVIETQKPKLDIVVAEGRPPKKGADGSYILAVDVGETVGEIRLDGSIDYKNRHVFQNVKKGQVLLIRRFAAPGEDGINVLGEPVKGLPGTETKIDALEGVEVMPGGVEYKARIDGIVEFKGKSIRVISGLLVSTDVNFKTGHIQGGSADVFIKGGVLPDFVVKSEGLITIQKVAEACVVEGKKDVRIRGGIIGKGRGRVIVGGSLEALYISNGATIEVQGDITIGTEILNSDIRSVGSIQCIEGAGTISGGEIWAFKGLKTKVLGSTGSEQNTVVYLGQHYFARRHAEQQIKDAQLDTKIQELEAKIQGLTHDLSLILTERESSSDMGVELQERYQKAVLEKKVVQEELDMVKLEKDAILSNIPYNDTATITILEVVHPGVTIKYKDISWTLKGELRAVEIRWDKLTSNIISKRL